MAELLKSNLSLEKILLLGNIIKDGAIKYDIDFNQHDFSTALVDACREQGENEWSALSLMQRMRAAAQALYSTMKQQQGGEIVVAALQDNHQVSGWLSLVCCEYIAVHKGLSLEQGLSYLQKMTEFFSAEFAIRHLIIKQPEETLVILTRWLDHENYHVRRLISEGTRPRLPWGVRLSVFIEQPERTMPLLVALRDDEEEYVRRSVANHLNDIAKDHPQLIIETAQQWLADDALAMINSEQRKQRIKLVRHSCRTLLKQGQPEVLALFGYYPATDVRCTLISNQLSVPFSGEFEFELLLVKETDEENFLMIDYVMHFQKANGKQGSKVFKWLDRRFSGSVQEKVARKHSFKEISTRKYYPGSHYVEVMVNGIKKARIEFELLENKT